MLKPFFNFFYHVKHGLDYIFKLLIVMLPSFDLSTLCYICSQDFRQLLDDDLGLLVKLRALLNDWVQEGFQDFFRKLDNHFLLLSGKINSTGQDQGLTEGTQKEKFISGLLVVLAQLSVFIEQSAIPRITEVGSSFLFPIMLFIEFYASVCFS